MENEGPRTLAEKLAVAGTVAPILRQRAGKGRRVVLTDAEGKPVKETTDVEVAMGLLRRADIDFSVQPGGRPEWVVCELCKKPFRTEPKGPIPKRCRAKAGSCPDCGKLLMQSCTGRGRCKPCSLRLASDRVEERKAAAHCVECGVPIMHKFYYDGDRRRISKRCRRCGAGGGGANRKDIREAILVALDAAGGLAKPAAAALGIPYTTLKSRLKSLVAQGLLSTRPDPNHRGRGTTPLLFERCAQ